jgi:hypothetical protein
MTITHEMQACLKPLVKFLTKIETGVTLLVTLGAKEPCSSPAEMAEKDIGTIKTAVMKDIVPAFASVPKIIHECKGLNPHVIKTLPTYELQFETPEGEAYSLIHAAVHGASDVERLKLDVKDIIESYGDNNPTKAGYYIGSVISTLFGKPGDDLLDEAKREVELALKAAKAEAEKIKKFATEEADKIEKAATEEVDRIKQAAKENYNKIKDEGE